MLKKQIRISPLIVHRAVRGQRGIALILVTFIIALATIIVVNLTYSTYLSARSNAVVERSLEAEYILKSAINLSIALLKADNAHLDFDGPQNLWAKFINGIPLPPELLGIQDPTMTLELEITPENQKFPVKALIFNKTVQEPTRDMLARLFEDLGFDVDTEEVAPGGLFGGVFFDSKALVANLIDYMSETPDTYSAPNFPKGVKEILPKNTFPNRPPDNISELAAIPGFTPHRLQVLSTLLTTYDQSKININFAPVQILKCLDPQIGQGEIQQILDFRNSDDGPFKSADDTYQKIVGPAIYQQTSKIIGYNSRYFQIIAKVEYGAKAYFARAIVVRDGTTGNGEPEVISLQMI